MSLSEPNEEKSTNVFSVAKLALQLIVLELDFVVKKASTSCIVIALVAIVRQDIFGLGLFYYLLKILAMIKIFFTPVSKESSPGYVGILVDVTACFILSGIRDNLEEDYMILDNLDRAKLGKMYGFSLHFVSELQINFIVRTLSLLIHAVYKLLQEPLQ